MTGNNVFFALHCKEKAINKFLPIMSVPSPAIGANMSKEDVIELRDYLTLIIEGDDNADSR